MKNIETLSIDIETFSSISLKDCGVYKYCQSDDFEILLFSYSTNNEEVITIDVAQGKIIPKEILEALEDNNITKWAFNAQFERVCLCKYLNKYLEPNSWRCSMVWCASMGLPLSLELAGEVLGTNIKKMKEGKDLVKYFSIPCKPRKIRGYKTRNMPEDDPYKWMKFKEYNKADVEVEMAIKDKLKNYPMNDIEWDYYVLDQKINDTGILLDMDLVNAAIKADEINKEELLKILKEITHLNNPNSVQQLTGWLKRKGIETDSLDKKAVSKLMEEVDESIKEVLILKQLLGKTSVKKYHAMENACGNDNRARGLIQFYGATRTGRFAGRLIQVQNLPQNHIKDLKNVRALIKEGKYKEVEILYDSVPEVLSELIRTAFIPRDNHKFIVCDFSAIEARVIAWLANEKWRLELFKNGEDIYCKSASIMFKVPVEKHGVNSELRQKGKISELACGYGGSVGALTAMGALDMGLNEDELQPLINSWRESNPAIVNLWWSVDNKVKETIKTEAVTSTHGIKFSKSNNLLEIHLPSGRSLKYINPKIGVNKFGGESVQYEGIGSTKKWEKQESYGPKFVENIVQALSRDILCFALMNIYKAGFNTVMHVHDEAVVEVPLDIKVDDIVTLMTQNPAWAKGLPLNAEGFECEFYKKD